jgi:uncharacterized protein YeaO (DUF488 family)
MNVETCSIWSPFNDDDPERLHILITRHWPRGKTWADLRIDMHMSELSPSRDLLRQTKDRGDGMQISWNYFQDCFAKELSQSEKAKRAFQLLDKLRKHFTIVLLCYEPEGDECHRYLVKEILTTDTWWYK